MTQFEIDIECGEFYANTSQYKARKKQSIEMLETFFELCGTPYLALSWGKQSICIAHMVYQIRPQTPMVFTRSWESYLLHDFERVIANFTERYPVNWVDNYCDNVSWNTLKWKETRDLGQKDIQNMCNCVPDWNGVIMGLSKDESRARRITTSIQNTPHKGIFEYVSGKLRCTPVQDWTKNDIAAYVYENKISLLSEYHNFGLNARTTARMTRMFLDNNGLVNLKRRDMSAYNKIIQRFPDLLSKQ
jgi:3'-phosphoadenosine 5'-phosphosulfate sulfotransferase (PAPS reductase)/FAD synthetase